MTATCSICQKKRVVVDEERRLCNECEPRTISRTEILAHSDNYGYMHLSTQGMTMLALQRALDAVLAELEILHERERIP